MSGLVGHRGLLLASAAGPAPGLVEVVGTILTVASTSFPVAMPAVVDPNDLLLVVIASGGGTMTAPAGFTSMGSNILGASLMRAQTFRANAAGTEGGTSPVFTFSASQKAAAICHRVPAALRAIATNPEITRATSAVTKDPDPPSLTPSWGSANNFWITWAARVGVEAGSNDITAYPYPNSNLLSSSGTAGTDFRVATCYTQTVASTLDPPTFTGAAIGNGWISGNVAVRPV